MPLVTVKVSNNTPGPVPTAGGGPDAAAPGEAARAGGGVALAHQRHSAPGARAGNAPPAEVAGDRTRQAAAPGTVPAGRSAAAQHPAAKAPRGLEAAPSDGYELRRQQGAPEATKAPTAPTAGAAAAMARPQGSHTGVPARPRLPQRAAGAAGMRRPTGQAAARSSRSASQSGDGAVAATNERKARSDEDDPARSSPTPSLANDVRRGPWASTGTLAPPAVRPEAPTAFSAGVTALGYAAAARRAQAEPSAAQRALRPPVADGPRPGAKGASIGVTVGGQPASPLAARA